MRPPDLYTCGWLAWDESWCRDTSWHRRFRRQWPTLPGLRECGSASGTNVQGYLAGTWTWRTPGAPGAGGTGQRRWRWVSRACCGLALGQWHLMTGRPAVAHCLADSASLCAPSQRLTASSVDPVRHVHSPQVLREAPGCGPCRRGPGGGCQPGSLPRHACFVPAAPARRSLGTNTGSGTLVGPLAPA